MNNVVDFNQARSDKTAKEFPVVDIEEDIDEVEVMAVDMVYDILDYLDDAGIDIRANPKTIYDIVLLTETLKSLIHRTNDTPYPMQEITESFSNIADPALALNEFLS